MISELFEVSGLREDFGLFYFLGLGFGRLLECEAGIFVDSGRGEQRKILGLGGGEVGQEEVEVVAALDDDMDHFAFDL